MVVYGESNQVSCLHAVWQQKFLTKKERGILGDIIHNVTQYSFHELKLLTFLQN